MEKKVLEFIKNNNLFKNGDRVVVACSGGADSVALLVLLNKLKKELGISLVVVHVNHGIRGEEAKRDENYVRELSLKLGVDVLVKSVDAPKFAKDNKMTLEQAARELRYKALRAAKEEIKAGKIAVAHNIGDQSESVLMHLFRGAGLSGVIGMMPARGDIVRPLLEVDKKSLVDYLNVQGIDFKEDGTNSDINYTRNFIRHKIVAELEKVYPAVGENIYKFSKKMREVDSFILSKLPMGLIKETKEGVLLLKEVKEEYPLIVKRLIFCALEEMNARVDIEEKHIEQIQNLFTMQVGKKLTLPNGLEVVRVHEGILFEKKQVDELAVISFNVGEEIKTGLGTIFVGKEKSMGVAPGTLYMDLDKIPSNAVWRPIQNGDKFTKFSGGTKSVVKFLADKKIDVSKRKKMLILASGEEVLAVPGVEISEKVRITERTTTIASIKWC